MPVAVARRRFTVEEYHEMARAGVLTEDDRVELLAGEIVHMSPIGSRHAACVDWLNKVLGREIGDLAILRVQNPVRLSPYSEPEPDVALLKPRADFYARSHPGPEDVLLIIEVAETSVEIDREVKLPLYAEAGIPEVWIVDLQTQNVEVYRQPVERTYSVTETYTPADRLSSQAFPDASIALEELLGNI